MDINDLRSIVTVLSLAAFLGIVWWAYGGKRRARFDEAANLPFAEDEGDRVQAGPARHEQRKTS
ncbi:MAG: cbb3-type cytochrome c oxidase subunit 3 [Azospira sp.]|jgi:cytochrome c oxidase cbb3-type subunit 4|nr:cbb3-type cytochrome c oxidase subunit 3 [Azospira sp.]